MTSRNDMVLDTNALIADTTHLSAQEYGAYLRVLVALHRSFDGWINGSDSSLVKITGVSRSHWRHVRRALEPFLVRQGGQVSQKRILRDRKGGPNGCKGNGQDSFADDFEAKAGVTSTVTPRNAHIESKLNPLSSNLDSEAHLESLPRSQKTRARTALRADWQPTIAELDYAKQHGFRDERLANLIEAFSDYHLSNGNRMADWSAAWRTWVRNEVKFNSKRSGGNNGKKRTGIVDAWDKLIQRADEDAEDSASGQGSMRLLPPR